MDNTKRKRFTFKEKEDILEKTDRRCAHCGKVLNEDTMTIEHIYPISKGGGNDEFNLVALCEDCNENKSNFIYAIEDYYGYIKSEYRQLYKSRLILNRANNKSEKKNFLPYDSLQFTVIPEASKKILYQMSKRKSKKITSEMVDRMSIKFKLSKAYPGDAKEVYELFNKRLDKRHAVELNEEMYTGEYNILNDIYDHEVVVLRKDREIHGAFIFKKVNINDFDFAQLRNIEDETVLRVKYIMTLAVVSRLAEEAFGDIMEALYTNIMRKNAIPLYFNILTDTSFTDYDKFIKIPYSVEKINGNIIFPSLKTIREYEKEELKASYISKQEGEYNEEDIELLVEYQINNKDKHIGVDELPKEVQDACQRLGIKTRIDDFRQVLQEDTNE